MNNLNFGYNEEQLKIQMQQFRNSFRTKASLKWSLILLIGLFPMLLGWILFGGNDGSNKIFSNNDASNAIIQVGYGIQWLIAISIIIFSFVTAFLFVKNNKDVKGDIYGNIIAFAFIVINFWLFDIGGWRWLTVWFMYLAGYLSAQFVRFIIFVNHAKKQSEKLQESFRQGQNPFQGFMSEDQFNQMQNNMNKSNNPYYNQQSSSKQLDNSNKKSKTSDKKESDQKNDSKEKEDDK